MIKELTGLANDGKVLVIALAGVLWLAATLAIGVLRRSFLSALGVFIAGGFLMWMMVNSDWVRDRSGEDILRTGAPVAEVEASWTSIST